MMDLAFDHGRRARGRSVQLETHVDYLWALPAFLQYFGTALALMLMYLFVYAAITPYREFTLIREGNVAAAIAMAGAMLGVVVPLASVVAYSSSLIDLAVWGLVALVIQLLALLIVRLIFRDLVRQIETGGVAEATFLAAMAVSVGVLTAACMTF